MHILQSAQKNHLRHTPPRPNDFHPCPGHPLVYTCLHWQPQPPLSNIFFWVHTILNNILGFDTIITRYLRVNCRKCDISVKFVKKSV